MAIMISELAKKEGIPQELAESIAYHMKKNGDRDLVDYVCDAPLSISCYAVGYVGFEQVDMINAAVKMAKLAAVEHRLIKGDFKEVIESIGDFTAEFVAGDSEMVLNGNAGPRNLNINDFRVVMKKVLSQLISCTAEFQETSLGVSKILNIKADDFGSYVDGVNEFEGLEFYASALGKALGRTKANTAHNFIKTCQWVTLGHPEKREQIKTIYLDLIQTFNASNK